MHPKLWTVAGYAFVLLGAYKIIRSQTDAVLYLTVGFLALRGSEPS